MKKILTLFFISLCCLFKLTLSIEEKNTSELTQADLDFIASIKGEFPQQLTKKFIASHEKTNKPIIGYIIRLSKNAEEEKYNIIKTLIEVYGANPNINDHFTWPPLFEAIRAQYISLIKLLLENGADVNCNIYNHTPLTTAILLGIDDQAKIMGNIDIVKLLLENGASPNRLPCGRTPISSAICAKNMECLNLLLNYGAQIQTYDLGTAALNNEIEIIKFLLAQGAPINNADGYCCALMDAAEVGNLEIINLLLLNDGKVNDNKGNSLALMWAIVNGNIEIIKVLLENGASVNSHFSGGKTALMEAIDKGNLDAVKLLLDHGADINILNKEQRTAKDIAKERTKNFKNTKETNRYRIYELINKKMKEINN